MPNWCSNSIVITGDEKVIRKLRFALESIEDKKSPCVFKTLVGRKPNLTEEEYNDGGWYEANTEYWGTKWDVCYDECYFEFTPTTITFTPETAWAPPEGFGKLLANIYKVNVDMEFSEPGMDYSGSTTFTPDGFMEEHNYTYMEGMYKLNKESFWEDLKSNIEYIIEEEPEKELAEYLGDFEYINDEDAITVGNMFNEIKNKLTNGK